MKPWRYAPHLLAVLSLTLFGQVTPTAAQDAGEVIARGMNSPRHMIWDPATSSLLVAEAGVGGDAPIDTPVGPAMWGPSGRILQVAQNGTVTPIIVGLPSYAARGGVEVVGPGGIALRGRELWGVNAGHGPSEEGFGWVWRVNLDTEEVTNVADLTAFEVANNPDGCEHDSNPYDVALDPAGNAIVADAGANTVLSVTPNGEVSVLAVVDFVPAPFPNPGCGGELVTSAVPTGVAVDADGNTYVSTLTGFPFTPLFATIYQYTPGGDAVTYAGGLTLLTAVAVGPDGHVYALEFSEGFSVETTPPGFVPNSGRVIRLANEGPQVVAEGLNFPTGMTFSPNGDLYVAVNGGYVPPQGLGMIMRWRGVAAP